MMNVKLKLLQHLSQSRNEGDSVAGLTIIEGLLAIVIVTILIMAIGPVLAFAAATRIQARRIDLASQAASSYMNGVMSGTIPAPPIKAVGSVTGTPPNYTDELRKISAPSTGSLACNNPETHSGYCTDPATATGSILYCADGDGDGKCTPTNKDFAIQAMGVQRTQSTPPATNAARADLGYLLGIRVYRADAFGKNITLKTSGGSQNERVQASTITGGLGNLSVPLVEMAAEIATDETQYQNLCNRLNNGGRCGS